MAAGGFRDRDLNDPSSNDSDEEEVAMRQALRQAQALQEHQKERLAQHRQQMAQQRDRNVRRRTTWALGL